jgi:hypothetical protein
MRSSEWRKKADVAISLISDAIDASYSYPLQSIREKVSNFINTIRV